MTRCTTTFMLCLTLEATLMFGADPPAGPPAAQPGRVLRHVVLCQFKESVTPETVEQLEDRFRALPKQIDAIVDFEWGKDVSVEELAQGFTHCFRVTFRDEKGREAYLPHPDHLALVAAVKPQLEKVLVVDYWTDLTDQAARQQKDPHRLLRHVVLFKYQGASNEEAVAEMKKAFEALPGKIDAIHDFECGADASVEGLADGFQHCFCVTFECEEGRAAYLPHPEHKAFVALLKPHLDKVLVVDYWTSR